MHSWISCLLSIPSWRQPAGLSEFSQPLFCAGYAAPRRTCGAPGRRPPSPGSMSQTRTRGAGGGESGAWRAVRDIWQLCFSRSVTPPKRHTQGPDPGGPHRQCDRPFPTRSPSAATAIRFSLRPPMAPPTASSTARNGACNRFSKPPRTAPCPSTAALRTSPPAVLGHPAPRRAGGSIHRLRLRPPPPPPRLPCTSRTRRPDARQLYRGQSLAVGCDRPAPGGGRPPPLSLPFSAARPQECQEMLSACDRHRVPLFVAYYRRAMPYFLKVKELLEARVVGPVHVLSIKLHQTPKQNPGPRPSPSASPWALGPLCCPRRVPTRTGRLRPGAGGFAPGGHGRPSGHSLNRFFLLSRCVALLRGALPDCPVNRRPLPSNHRQSPSNRRWLPSNRRRLPSIRRRLPSNRRRLPSNRRRLPSNRRRLTAVGHHPTAAGYPATPVGQPPTAVAQPPTASSKALGRTQRNIGHRDSRSLKQPPARRQPMVHSGRTRALQ